MRERYEDDPSNPDFNPDFNPDLWMEVGSSGGPDKNRMYRFSNTTAENLRAAHSVSTVGSSQIVASTQFGEFMALKQQYERLSTDYKQLRQMVMDIRSQMGDTYALLFWLFGSGNNQPPPPPPPPPPPLF